MVHNGGAWAGQKATSNWPDALRKTPLCVQHILKAPAPHCGQRCPWGACLGSPVSPGRRLPVPGVLRFAGEGVSLSQHPCSPRALSSGSATRWIHCPAALCVGSLQLFANPVLACSLGSGSLKLLWLKTATTPVSLETFLLENPANPLPFPVCAGCGWLHGDNFVSPCQKGVFRLMNEDYFIEPVPTSFREEGAAQPHRIYKRQAPERGAEQGRRAPAPRETCGVQGTVPFLLCFCSGLVAAGSLGSCRAHRRKTKGAGPSLTPCVASADSLVLNPSIHHWDAASIPQRHRLPVV